MKFTGKYLDGIENPHQAKIYKSFNSETKADEQNGKRLLVARITTPSSDRSRDRVSSKGAVLGNFMKNPVVLFAHDYASKPIAKCVNLKTTDDGIIATVEFTPEGLYNEADIIYTMYKEGFLNAWSIGFMPTDYEPNEDGGYNFKEWEMFEFSSVPVPDNPEALTVMRSKGINVEEVAEKIKTAGIEIDTKTIEENPEEKESTEPPVTTDAAGEQGGEEQSKETEEEVKVADLTVTQLKDIITPRTIEKDVAQVTSLSYILGDLEWICQAFEANEVSESTTQKLEQAVQLIMDAIKEQAILGQKTFTLNDTTYKAGRTISGKHEVMLKEAMDHMDQAMNKVKSVTDAVVSDDDGDEEKSAPTSDKKMNDLKTSLKKSDKHIGLTLRLLNEIERERKETRGGDK